MTWTYSGDPSVSNLDAVRFYLSDTDSTDPLMTDEEITFLINKWIPEDDSVILIASIAADTLAGKFAREVSISADGVSVGAQDLQSKFEALAASLREMYSREQQDAAPESFGNNYGETYDPSIKPLSFGIGQYDNPEAGPQQFVGPYPLPYSEEFNG